MEFSIKSGSPEKQRGACAVIGIFEAGYLSPSAEALDKASGNAIGRLVRQGDFAGKAGTSLVLHGIPSLQFERILLVGLGKEKAFGDKEYCTAVRTAMKALADTAATEALLTLTALPLGKRSTAWKIRQAVIVAEESRYRFEQFKSKKDEEQRPLNTLTLAIDQRKETGVAEAALAQGLAIAEGVRLAKNLGNLPGNVCTPAHLAETALQMAGEHALECQILEREEMEQLGMNALLSVSDRSGLLDLANALLRHGFELVSTGGTGYARGNARMTLSPDAAGVAGTLTVTQQIEKDGDTLELVDAVPRGAPGQSVLKAGR